ncbi:Protein SERAC1 [Penicillium brevicompactum]
MERDTPHWLKPLQSPDVSGGSALHIINVSGLAFHKDEWREETAWIKRRLLHRFPQARVLDFRCPQENCFSSETEPFSSPHNEITRIASTLANAIDNVSSRDKNNLSLIFIVHGLGGVLVKQAILLALEVEEYSYIARSMKLMICFDAPHRSITTTMHPNCKIDLITKMPTHSLIEHLPWQSYWPVIEEINIRFSQLGRHCHLLNFYLCEKGVLTGIDRNAKYMFTTDSVDDTNIQLDKNLGKLGRCDENEQPITDLIVKFT